ncbi:hypothetical protein [Candidatus Amoebophilus asiaticus]|nr:hypothetical protein [Candidatus Amoebophilus asiaticus]
MNFYVKFRKNSIEHINQASLETLMVDRQLGVGKTIELHKNIRKE